ncbi:MAG: DegQ family serine endoprotease [Alphaproteobacteria bacterium]|nr:DegQ family serine endoprotease [Alphaproteobacteria bacterium]
MTLFARRLLLSLTILCAALLSAKPLFADTPKTAAEMKSSFAPIVKKATPAVVNVYAARVQKGVRNPLLDDPFFQYFFGLEGGTAPDRVQRSTGSGVIVDSEGLVVTNQHVIEGMTEVKVALSDKREFDADIVLRDPKTDLAVLRLRGVHGLPVIELGNSDAIEVGDLVLAIGNPFGVGQTVTSGIISALSRSQVSSSDYQLFIQTDAAINPGNSGGALVDVSGRLIGINTAIYSKTGASVGIGFAIPVNMVKVVVASARQGSKIVRRPWFGARMQPVTADLAESLGLERPVGAVIVSVVDKGPAADAGLKAGDVILALDGQPVDDADGFGFRLATKAIGDRAELKINRGGKVQTLTVRMDPAPEMIPRDQRVLVGRWPLSGAVIANMSPALAEELAVESGTEGVIVVSVKQGSPADDIGLQKGDYLISIDNNDVKTTRDVVALQQERAYYWSLVIRRKGELMKSKVGG